MINNASVSVVEATIEDKPVIANLIQLYLYDMTADLPFPVGRDGRFEYDFLARFWQHPYLIFSGPELAGFAFVVNGSPISDSPDRHFMAEFFVLKAYRGQGVGSSAFAQLIERHIGPWQLGVIEKNGGASAFWAKSLSHTRPPRTPTTSTVKLGSFMSLKLPDHPFARIRVASVCDAIRRAGLLAKLRPSATDLAKSFVVCL